MKLKELQSSTSLPRPPIAVDDEPQVEAQVPRFVDEHVIAQVLDVPVKTLRNWRVSGRGPPFCKFGACVRYEFATAVAWARTRQVRSTSEVT